jgi:hypothetical protein
MIGLDVKPIDNPVAKAAPELSPLSYLDTKKPNL